MLQELQADMNRLDDVLRYPQAPEYAQAGIDASDRRSIRADGPKLTGRVELRDVTFGYSPLERPLIEDFNLTRRAGAARGDRRRQRQRQEHGREADRRPLRAVVGTRSCSTASPRPQLPRDVLTNSIGCVDQDIFLFRGNVSDNVQMWDETMRDAARRAGLPRRRDRAG